MPTESRSIVFSPQEIVTAVADFHDKRKLPIPKGKVVGLAFSAPPDIEGTFHILADGAEAPANFVLNSTTLAAALVFYCINRGIPLPVLATKQLRRKGDNLELVVSNIRHG